MGELARRAYISRDTRIVDEGSVEWIDDQLVLRDLPFQQPLVHVDAIWHRRAQHGQAHEWLRQALLRSAKAAFAGAPGGPA